MASVLTLRCNSKKYASRGSDRRIGPSSSLCLPAGARVAGPIGIAGAIAAVVMRAAVTIIGMRSVVGRTAVIVVIIDPTVLGCRDRKPNAGKGRRSRRTAAAPAPGADVGDGAGRSRRSPQASPQ